MFNGKPIALLVNLFKKSDKSLGDVKKQKTKKYETFSKKKTTLKLNSRFFDSLLPYESRTKILLKVNKIKPNILCSHKTLTLNICSKNTKFEKTY